MQLTISSPVIWLYPEKVDFRKSIDGLSELIHACDLGDVYKDVFVFANRRVDKLKILAWHKNGFVLLYKRLEKKRLNLFAFCVLCGGSGGLSISGTKIRREKKNETLRRSFEKQS